MWPAGQPSGDLQGFVLHSIRCVVLLQIILQCWLTNICRFLLWFYPLWCCLTKCTPETCLSVNQRPSTACLSCLKLRKFLHHLFQCCLILTWLWRICPVLLLSHHPLPCCRTSHHLLFQLPSQMLSSNCCWPSKPQALQQLVHSWASPVQEAFSLSVLASVNLMPKFHLSQPLTLPLVTALLSLPLCRLFPLRFHCMLLLPYLVVLMQTSNLALGALHL